MSGPCCVCIIQLEAPLQGLTLKVAPQVFLRLQCLHLPRGQAVGHQGGRRRPEGAGCVASTGVPERRLSDFPYLRQLLFGFLHHSAGRLESL